jgi:uncharacterized membrane protein YidH (DUF202 family)
MDAPFDPGLQPERTLLAWRRTCLALAVGSAVGTRFTAGLLGPTAVVVGLAGLGLSAFAYAAASARYRRTHGTLTSDAAVLTTGALPMIAVTVTAFAVGIGALLFVVLAPGQQDPSWG